MEEKEEEEESLRKAWLTQPKRPLGASVGLMSREQGGRRVSRVIGEIFGAEDGLGLKGLEEGKKGWMLIMVGE